MKKAKSSSKKSASPAPPQFLFGFKDPDGNVRIPAIYEMLGDFSGPYGRAKQNGKWGVISKSGEWLFEPKFDFLGKVENAHVTYRVDKLWGLADLHGNELSPAQFDEIISIGKTVFTVRSGYEFKVLDFKMKEVIGGFSKAFRWSDGFTVAVKDDLCGLLKENGQWLIEPGPQALYDFSEGLAAFERDGICGYYDVNGKVAIPAQFQAAYDFSEGLACVKIEDKLGYIDKSGRIVIPCEWDDPTKKSFSGYDETVLSFRNGYARVARMASGTYLEAGLLDRAGKWHEDDAFAKDPRTVKELEIFRESNPEWEAFQEGVELGDAFTKKLDRFREKLDGALEKDRPTVVKFIQKIAKHQFPPHVRWLRLTIYDMNDHGLVLAVVGKDGEDSSFDANSTLELDKLTPFKNTAKLYDAGVMDEPKTSKGNRVLEEFYESCAQARLEWFAQVWSEAASEQFSLPCYIENEDESYLWDVRNMRRVTQAELRKMFS